VSKSLANASAAYQLLDEHYETVKGVWEERFQRRRLLASGKKDRAMPSSLANANIQRLAFNKLRFIVKCGVDPRFLDQNKLSAQGGTYSGEDTAVHFQGRGYA
jgi:hypothetical protein